MFDLETAISTWKHGMKHRRVFNPDDIEELETHLRQQVKDLMAAGHSPEDAFRVAIRDMGNPVMAESEYRKVYWGKLRNKNRIGTEIRWRIGMFANYFKTAMRNMMRHKGVAAINLGGLAIALAACLLIGHYIQDELYYDTFHADADRLYRVGRGTTGWPYGRIMEAEYPEVQEVLYMRSYPSMSIKHEGTYYFENLLYAEAEFFDLFDFPLIAGDPETALATPYSVVLSETLAERLFGPEPAVGKGLTLRDSLDFTVTGVVSVPEQSHIQFDALLSFETLRAIWGADAFEQQMSNGWLDMNVVNYVLLEKNANPERIAEKVRDMPETYAGEALAHFGISDFTLEMEPVQDIYLWSRFGNALGPKSDISYVYLLGAVGLFLLLIASANFINLMTARSVERTREVGVRKAVGSTRGALVQQFLGESFLTAAFAMVGAIGLAAAALPLFNGLAGKSYVIPDLWTPATVLVLVILVLVVGLLAGLYPALSLSGYSPAKALRSQFTGSPGGARLRKGLVVFQFTISAVLILATLVVLEQNRFMESRDLGFDGEQVVVIDGRQAPSGQRAARGETFVEALEGHPAIETVSAAFAVPGRSGWRGQLSFPEGYPDGGSIELEYLAVDHDYVDALGLNIMAGRDFDLSRPSDAQTAVIINEAAALAAGWNSPAEAVGKSFTSPGSGKPDGVVIGVIEDYHHHSLDMDIEPMMLGISRGAGLYAVRLQASGAAGALDHVRSTWPDYFGAYPYEVTFQDEMFGRQYEEQRRLGRIFGTFAGLTILIACLGLFGLATFVISRRTKEIGVRKVLGASSGQIVRLLSYDFVKLVGVSLVLASPIAWYAMNNWLRDYPVRIGIGPMFFLVTGGLVLLVTLGTVSYRAMTAASANPVRSLRYE